jgi:hypothetical protein
MAVAVSVAIPVLRIQGGAEAARTLFNALLGHEGATPARRRSGVRG